MDKIVGDNFISELRFDDVNVENPLPSFSMLVKFQGWLVEFSTLIEGGKGGGCSIIQKDAFVSYFMSMIVAMETPFSWLAHFNFIPS